ncbi:MAG: leucine-rich repeat protein, partial [Lachnospiraceae bacterium]|nr:leucine-rich repeat protein [Lachnospiraceae bacterium]
MKYGVFKRIIAVSLSAVVCLTQPLSTMAAEPKGAPAEQAGEETEGLPGEPAELLKGLLSAAGEETHEIEVGEVFGEEQSEAAPEETESDNEEVKAASDEPGKPESEDPAAGEPENKDPEDKKPEKEDPEDSKPESAEETVSKDSSAPTETVKIEEKTDSEDILRDGEVLTSGDFKYTQVEGGVEITGYVNGIHADAVIPNEIDGKAVISIKASAFSGCNVLTSITIPNSVTKIGNYAFQNCKYLTTAHLGTGLQTMGGSVFSGCELLNTVNIPKSLTKAGYNDFYDCPIGTVSFEAGITAIPANLFEHAQFT